MKIQMTTSDLKPDDSPGEFKEQTLTLTVTADHHTIDRIVDAIHQALATDRQPMPNGPIPRDYPENQR